MRRDVEDLGDDEFELALPFPCQFSTCAIRCAAFSCIASYPLSIALSH
ncbi:MAG: hypothetical protein JWN68_1482 [Nocardioides sp.]|jgi:hypothetical protein|nr:hypothetical protein [Nocardioides sp.]